MSIVEYRGPTSPQEIRRHLERKTKDEIITEYLRQWREFGKVLEERDAAAEYTHDQAVMDLVATALGVPDEPHQGRAERILEAAEAVVAHQERLRQTGNRVVNYGCGPDEWDIAVQEVPTASLARRELAAKAIGMSWAATMAKDEGLHEFAEQLGRRSNELLRQAEEDAQ